MSVLFYPSLGTQTLTVLDHFLQLPAHGRDAIVKDALQVA